MAGTSLIEAYLEQLRTELPRRPDTDDVIAEVEDHLHSIVEAHLTLGLTEDAAVRHALGAFGSADLVSRAFAQQQGNGIAMPTAFTTYAGAATSVGGALLGICLAVGSIRWLDVGSTTAWFAPVTSSAGLLVALGLVGIHARHRAVYGSLGRVASVLLPIGVVGTIVSAYAWFAPGALVGFAVALIGLVGLGIEVWRQEVISRGAVGLVGLGLVTVPLASLLTSEATTTWTAGTIVGMAAFGLLGAGIAWLGHGLWRERGLAGLDAGGRPPATT